MEGILRKSAIAVGFMALMLAVACRSSTFNVVGQVTIAAPSPIPTAVIGQAYSLQLTASGGDSPYTYALVSGTMPPGLTLSASTGLISGTPTTIGAYTPSFRACDGETPAQCSATLQVDPEVVARKKKISVSYGGQPLNTHEKAIVVGTKPTISSISPSTAIIGYATPVTITGTGFEAGATVTFGSAATGEFPCSNVNVVSSTEIQCVVNLVGDNYAGIGRRVPLAMAANSR
jgi:large repetitive protein